MVQRTLVEASSVNWSMNVIAMPFLKPEYPSK